MPQNCHGFKNKGSLTNCQNQEDPESCPLKTTRYPGEDAGTENTGGKPGTSDSSVELFSSWEGTQVGFSAVTNAPQEHSC